MLKLNVWCVSLFFFLRALRISVPISVHILAYLVGEIVVVKLFFVLLLM